MGVGRDAAVYPALLAAGVRIERCHDLRLCAAILDHSTLTGQPRSAGRSARPAWLAPGPAEAGAAFPPTLRDRRTPCSISTSSLPTQARRARLSTARRPASRKSGNPTVPVSRSSLLARELERQQAMVAESADPRALRLLLAAESAGALVGAEMHAAGLPWDRAVHERVLEEALGARPKPGFKPARVEELAADVRAALDGPSVNLDSQVDLLRALRRAGIQVDSTSRWELGEHEHPAIEPLIAYKKLMRLLSANGWAWLDEWVHRWSIPTRLRAGRHRDGALGDVGWRRAPAPEDRAPRGGGRPGVDPGDRRRGPTRTPGARRHGPRRGHGCGWSRPGHLPRHRRVGGRRDPRPGEGRDPRRHVRRDHGRQRAARAEVGTGVPRARWPSSTVRRPPGSAGEW